MSFFIVYFLTHKKFITDLSKIILIYLGILHFFVQKKLSFGRSLDNSHRKFTFLCMSKVVLSVRYQCGVSKINCSQRSNLAGFVPYYFSVVSSRFMGTEKKLIQLTRVLYQESGHSGELRI